MSILNVGGNQVTPVNFEEDTTIFNGSKVLVLIGSDANNPDTPLQPQSGYTLEGGRRYFIQTVDKSQQTLTLLSGHKGGFSLTTAPVPPTETNAPILILLNQRVTAGATVNLVNLTSGRLPIATFVSVVGTLFAQSIAAQGANPYYRFRSQWSNSNDNFDAEITTDFVCATGPFSFVQNYRHDYTSPCFDDTLSMSVTNYDTTDINFTIGLFGSYRGRSLMLRGRYPDSLANEANGLGTDDILMSLQQAAIPAGQKGAAVIVPLFAGDVVLTGTLAGEAAAGQTLVTFQPQPSSVIAAPILARTSAAGIFNQPSFKLPRRACTMQVDNTAGTAPVTPNLLLIGNQPN